ncbi:acyltransferase [Eubacterium sp. MSJ-21]|nr:acyltransferase [Eubacterium sp. MSJ-21]
MLEIKKRQSNLELFRIVSMFVIVAHHYVVNSGLLNCVTAYSTHDLLILVFGWGGKTAINCFVLITGYFMCTVDLDLKDKKSVRTYLVKLLRLIAEIEFYNISIYFIFLLTGYQKFDILDCFKAFMPIDSIRDGFTSCFLTFYLIIPFLAKFTQRMSEQEHRYLIGVLLLIYTVFPSVGMDVSFNYVTWFSVLFIIASYIRLHSTDSCIIQEKYFNETRLWGCLTLLMLMISWASILSVRYNDLYFYVSDANKILALSTAVCAFMFFKNLNVPYSRVINKIAASTYGVLVIHANSDTMRQWLWKDVFNNVGHYEKTFPYAIGVVCLVYIVCTLIDMLRINVLEKPIFKVDRR